MTTPPPDPVSTALRAPDATTGMSLPQWETLIRFARRANLLGRLASVLRQRKLLEDVPGAPRAHLQSALVMASGQALAVHRELASLATSLRGVVDSVVLLKGAAYLAANLPAASGRLFSDIDILVPRTKLDDVESSLMLDGWATTHHHAYDQRYYRKWMHELPPMRHIKRMTVLDVHHTILPVTARAQPDPSKLLAAAVPVEALPFFRVLAPTDMVLHSATHLFHNEELDQGLRDLADLDALLRHFGSEPRFWSQLAERAVELELLQPLAYALRYAMHFFGTPVPRDLETSVEGARSASMFYRLMDLLFLRAMRPDVSGRYGVQMARKCLYVRAHWLRMPLWLLAYHLTMKTFRGEDDAPAA